MVEQDIVLIFEEKILLLRILKIITIHKECIKIERTLQKINELYGDVVWCSEGRIWYWHVGLRINNLWRRRWSSRFPLIATSMWLTSTWTKVFRVLINCGTELVLRYEVILLIIIYITKSWMWLYSNKIGSIH